jgi:NADH-quinone oxidoreductase subunit I
MAKDEQNRPMKAFGRTFPYVFDIDISICMSCRICVDVCPFDAIKMDNRFALSCNGRFDDLVIKKEGLLKSAKYFAQINPTEASASDKRISEKSAKIAKPQQEEQSGLPPSQARKPFFYPDA